MLSALAAAACMVLVDVLSVILVQAEAANRGWLAGAVDTLAWLPGIVCTTLCVSALESPSAADKVAVLLFVGAANFFGTKLGQVLGQRLLAHSARKRMGLVVVSPKTPEERLAYLEHLLGVKR